MIVKTTKISNFDGLELKSATFKQKEFPDHFHDSFSFGIITQGVEKIRVKENDKIALNSSIIVFNQNETHSNRNFDNDNCSFLTCYISIDLINYIVKKYNLPKNINVHFENIIYDSELNYDIKLLHNPLINNKIDLLEKTLIRFLSCHTKTLLISKNCNVQIVDDIKFYINQNLFNKITIPNLAKKFNIDKFKLIKLFKSVTGLTPINYMIIQRLNYSKELISKKLPLVDVALECGFYDQSCFTNYFTKYYGISPLNYCKSHFESTF